MNELLPCPFCGSLAEVLEHEEVACTNCGASIKSAEIKTPEQAAETWNSRVPYEADGYFFLPKPKKEIIYTSETMVERTEHGYRMGAIADVYENAVREWKEQLNQHIVERICEVFSKDKTCYSERDDCWECSECGFLDAYAMKEAYNYCPSCGRKVER